MWKWVEWKEEKEEKEEDDAEKVEIRLHFVGSRYYTRSSFIKEARRFGVARAIAPSHLKSLNWGDIVYLAEYEPGVESGKAIVFGYIRVDGVSIEASERVKREAEKEINVERVEKVGKQAIRRACGGYFITSIAYVRDPLPKIAETYERIAKKYGEKVKFLLNGTLTTFEHELIIENVKFARGIQKVKVRVSDLLEPEIELGLKNFGKRVFFISDYQRR